jgi:hypothetical protein
MLKFYDKPNKSAIYSLYFDFPFGKPSSFGSIDFGKAASLEFAIFPCSSVLSIRGFFAGG